MIDNLGVLKNKFRIIPMLTLPLLACHSLTNKLGSSFKSTLNAVSACHVSDKIKAIATALLKASTSLYLCGFGTTELGKKFKKSDFHEKSNATENKVIKASSAYLNLHGGLL